MSGLGPRVGGAHVDVNLKFDETSIDAVAKRIHQQLASIGRHNREVYRSIGRESVAAWRAALGATVAAAPLMGSLISGLAGQATLLAGALNSSVQSLYGLLPIMTSLGLAGLTAGIGMRNFSAAVSETNPKALQELLAGMPQSMKDAVMVTRELNDEMRAAIWPKLFADVGDGIERLKNTGVVQRGLGAMADSINGLVTSLLDYANTKDGISTIDTFLKNNARVFAELSKAAVPFLDGFLRLVNALTPAALRLADRITGLAQSFSDTTQAEGFGKRINDMMLRAEKTAGLLFKVLRNLGAAIGNVFGVTNPATNSFLQVLVGITSRFREFTESAEGKNSIAEWAANSVEVFKQFKNTLKAVSDVIAELADSRVIISFLKTVEGAFKHLGDLPLDRMVNSFVQIAEALQPISSWLLAAIIAGATFNIFIGSIMGQIGGLFAVLGGFKNKGDLFKDLFGKGGAGKHAAEVGKFTTLLKGIGGVLGKGLRFAGLAGLAVWITTLISKSEKLQAKVREAFDAFKDLAKPLKDAFNEIKTALEPAGKALEPVFNLLDKIATLGIGLVLDTIIYAFESLGKVIEGAGKIIAGVIDFFTGLFTLDGSKMLDGLKKIGSGILPLLEGMFGLFVTFFAPARLFKLAGLAFKGLLGGLRGATPGILSFVGQFLLRMLGFFGRLVPRLLALGGRAIVSLAKAIGRAAPRVLSRIGRLVVDVIQWVGRLPGRLVLLGRHAITVLSNGMRNATPRVLSMAGRIVEGILTWIAKLPGRLFRLGVWAFKRLGEAVRGAVSKLTSAAKSVFDAIWNEIKSLPGQMLDLGKGIVGGIIDGITDKIGDLKDAVGKIGDAIGGFLPGSPVKEGPLRAWNYGGGATGGGRNVIDAITGGLSNTDPIRKAMEGVASAVSASLIPTVSGGAVETRRPRSDAGHLAAAASGGNIYISKMMPHNYGQFEREMREKKRLKAIGGRMVK